ncbi:MAG: hypothetical protein ACRCYU_11990 [Nocardioides sp.]
MQRGWINATVVAALAALLTFTAVSPALADGRVSADPAHVQADGSRGVCTGQATGQTSALPVSRWQDSTSGFHSRLGSKAWNDVAEKVQRNGVMSVSFGIGNTVWSVTSGLVEFATTLCVLDRVGGAADQTAGSIGRALSRSGLLAGVVVLSFIVVAWRSVREGGAANAANLGKKAIVLGVFGVMLAGAAGSTGGGIGESTAPYKPGAGSPGWFATRIDSAVTNTATIVTGSVQTQVVEGAEDGAAGTDKLGCGPYTKSLKARYKEQYGSSGVRSSAASVPLVVSSLWETGGLEAWKDAQFGTQSDYGDLMYCRLLEARSSVAANEDPDAIYDASVTTVHNATGSKRKVNTKALAWKQTSDNTILDRQMVGWAACASNPSKGKYMVAGGDANEAELKAACDRFFTEDGWDGDGEFDWDDSDDDISEALDTPATEDAKDFLLTLHGNKNGSGIVSGFAYLLGSLFGLVVFGLFAIAIIVAKIAAVVMIVLMFFVLLATLLPNSDMSKLGSYAKQYTGLSVFAFGAVFILSLLTFVSGLLTTAGSAVMPGGPGGVMSVLWGGLSPAVAALVLHQGFKRMSVPSPFRINGGIGWGQAAAGGALGAAAGVGTASLLDRAQDRAMSRGKQSLKSAMPGGADGRSQKMQAPGTGAAVPAKPNVNGKPDESVTPEQAKEWAGTKEGKKAIAKQAEAREAAKAAQRAARNPKAIAAARKAAALQRMSTGWDTFKHRPLHTSVHAIKGRIASASHSSPKNALTAAAVGTAAVATGGVAGAIAVGAAAAGKYAWNRENAKDPAAQTMEQEAYLEHSRQVRAEQARVAAEKEQRKAEKKAEKKAEQAKQKKKADEKAEKAKKKQQDSGDGKDLK